MSIFSKTEEPITGTKTNSVVAVVAAALVTPSVGLYFLLDVTAMLIPVLLWFIGIWQARKGMHSDAPGLAKVAKTIIWIDVVPMVLMLVFHMYTYVQLLIG